MRIRIPATGMVPITPTGRRRTTGMVRRTTAIAIRRTTATETGTTSVITPDVTNERLPGADQGLKGVYARLRGQRAMAKCGLRLLCPDVASRHPAYVCWVQ